MARADQIKALIQSHAEGDSDGFYAVAMQVAANAARAGHTNLAHELRELVDEAKTLAHEGAVGRAAHPVPIAQPKGELAGLLTATYPQLRLSTMSLEPALKHRLERIIHEQRQRRNLRAHGFAPLRKALLIGPPGTGKTMSASVLASELRLPLFTIQLDGLITKYMGETAAKLRVVFDTIADTRGVYLFDEFDALGSQRGAANDVGEIRRVLNSFLQFLELDDSDSLIIGATNHVELLDQALFRRFDIILNYGLPTEATALEVMQNRLVLLNTEDVDWNSVLSKVKGLSHAELVRGCEHAAKSVLLNHRKEMSTQDLMQALEERQGMKPS